MSGFFDTSQNFHPYECDGPGRCQHCDRKVSDRHDPATCALCDPEYDGGPALASDSSSSDAPVSFSSGKENGQ